MDARYHFKNGANPKSLTSRGNFLKSVKEKNFMCQTTSFKTLIIFALSSFMLSCGSTQKTPKPIPENPYSAIFVSEERGISFERITTDADAVASPGFNATNKKDATTTPSKYGVRWYPYAVIALSANDEKIGFISNRNNATNVMLKSTTQGGGATTQQTFRSDVRGFTFSPDGQKFLFNEYRNGNTGIFMMNVGSTIVQQISPSGSNDNVPTVTKNNILFFDRKEGSEFDFALWSYDMETRMFSNYSQGYSPCIDPSNDKIVYFARNTNVNIFPRSSPTFRTSSSVDWSKYFGSYAAPTAAKSSAPSKTVDSRRSEIWRFDIENSREELILSDPEMSFSLPQVSPDGKWILVTGAKKSTEDIWNTDIFVVRSDGTNFTQLTYNPVNDLSAIWSADGKSIYFLSQRGTEDGRYNVWRMNFLLSDNK